MRNEADARGEGGGRILGAVRAVVAAAGSGAERGPEPSSGKWWIAFSGGVDSTVLLDAAARVLGEAAPERLAAVHVHHGLHPDADAWEEHCRGTAERRGVALVVRRVTVGTAGERGRGRGLEASARAARYAALREAVPAGGPVLAGHHRDDQAETVLLRILRGAGPAGAAAMRPEAGRPDGLRVIRPLLAVPRAEILDYARERRLSWVEDPSNLASGHDRNYVRNEVLPAIADRWPGAPATLARFAEQAHEAAAMLDDLAAADLDAARGRTPGALRAAAIAELPLPRAANALRVWLAARHGTAPPPRRWLRAVVEEVAGAAPDRTPETVLGGVRVRRYRGELYSGRNGGRPPPLPVSTRWRLAAAPLDLPHGRLAASLEREEEEEGNRDGRGSGAGPGRLAAARVPAVVEIRFRQGGERCRPAGRGVSKPLKDLLREYGVPPWERGVLPLVFAEGRLAAAPGLFVCEPFAARAGEPAWRIEWTPRRG